MSIRLSAAQKTIWRIGILYGIALAAAAACSRTGNKVSHTVEAVPSQTIRVIDGDTIEINGKKIRLYGIDAPEKGQPCAKNDSLCDCGELSKGTYQDNCVCLKNLALNICFIS